MKPLLYEFEGLSMKSIEIKNINEEPIYLSVSYSDVEYKTLKSGIELNDELGGHFFLNNDQSGLLYYSPKATAYLLNAINQAIYHFKMNLGIHGEVEDTIEGFSGLLGVLEGNSKYVSVLKKLEKIEIELQKLFSSEEKVDSIDRFNGVFKFSNVEEKALEDVMGELSDLPSYYQSGMFDYLMCLNNARNIVKD